MLSKWDIILSDYSLSTQAIKSYEKLSKQSLFDVEILNTSNEIIKFSKSELLKYPGIRVIIHSKNKMVQERLEKYYKEIENDQIPGLGSTLKQMFEDYNKNLDVWLFGIQEEMK